MAIKYQKLDPADSMGAVDLFAEAGLIHPGTESSKPGRMNRKVDGPKSGSEPGRSYPRQTAFSGRFGPKEIGFETPQGSKMWVGVIL